MEGTQTRLKYNKPSLRLSWKWLFWW